MDKKAVGESLQRGKRSRFLAKEDIEAMTVHLSDAYNMHPYKGMWLVRCYHSFSAVGPDRAVRLVISWELGHERGQVTTVSLGR
jgi:hypothetical protein